MKWQSFFSILLFITLTDYCFGDCPDCADTCPYVTPPCYKVKISGSEPCPETYCSEPPEPFQSINGEYILKHYIYWSYGDGYNAYSYEDETTEIFFDLIFWWDYSSTSLSIYAPSYRIWGYVLQDPHSCSLTSGGEYACQDEGCCQYCGVVQGYLGGATWEPEWDCSACDNCSNLATHKTVYPDDTIYYSNLACCPPAGGEAGSITLDCNDAAYVVPQAPVISGNSALVKVLYQPGCRAGNSVTYTIQTIPTDPSGGGTTATVTCTAAFYTSYGETDSTSGSITVKPKCSKCCASGSGCPAAGL